MHEHQRPGDTRIGTVGRPDPGCLGRIADDGEILVKGDNVCAGYWHDDAATAELIDADGWMHSGDLGHARPDGYLHVTGRKKDLIITAYGKNISPEEIETALRMEPLIAQAVVIGDDRPYLTAGDHRRRCPRRVGGRTRARLRIRGADRGPELHAELDQAVERVNATHSHAEGSAGGGSYPRLHAGGGELTPTLKVKRHVVLERWGPDRRDVHAP